MRTFASEIGEPDAFSCDAIAALAARRYSGHVRELRGKVRAILVLTTDRPIRPTHIDGVATTDDDVKCRTIVEMIFSMGPPFDERLRQIGDALLSRVLLSATSKRAAARMFNIDPSTMRERIRKLKSRHAG